MRCRVYRSSLREGLYVYVAAPDASVANIPALSAADPDGGTANDAAARPTGGDEATGELDGLPGPVRRQLGRAELAMTLDLDEHRRLGQEDVHEVLANLAAQGFHVQMPRDIEPLVEAISSAAVSDAASRRATGDGRD